MTRLVDVPDNQKKFVKDSCQRDFVWDEQAHYLWLWAMEIACGIDKRFLSSFSDQQNFHDELHLFRTMGNTEQGNNSEKLFGYMQDSLNILLYEVIQKEYYELASNIKNIMDAMSVVEKYEVPELDI